MSVSSLLPSAAQESTPEPLLPTEPPTFTPLPTATATATFTDLPTLIPTATLTETPTATPTQTETPNPTAEFTAEIKPSMTPTATPLAEVTSEATAEATLEPLLPTVMPTEGLPPPAVQRSSLQVQTTCPLSSSEDFTIITRTGMDGGNDLETAINCANSGQVPMPYRIFIAEIVSASNPLAIDVKLNVTSSIKIYGRDPAASVLQSNGVVLFEIQIGGSLELHHVTVRGGRQGIPNGSSAYGGGLYNRGTLLIADSLVTDNRTISGGGAVLNDANATLIIQRSSLTANFANGGGALQNNGTATITCSRIDTNDSVFGGGIFQAGGSLMLTSSRLVNNTANVAYPLDIYALSSVTGSATSSYWGGDAPSVSASISTAPVLGSDPTTAGTADYNPACAPEVAVPIPPPWSDDGIVRIEFDAPIPILSRYVQCQRTESASTRIPCGVLAYNQYRNQQGGSITWGQFVSLVMYSEGQPILLGQLDSGSLILANPQDSGNGICWRLTGTDTWNSGSLECNRDSTTAPGVQNDFLYAVWEWLFKECAIATGFTDSSGNVDYEKDGVRYSGECSESGLVAFLGQVQSLYQDESFDKEVNLYLSRAQSEFVQWGWHDGSANRYRYGICPCVWGNVSFEFPENAPANVNPEKAARRNDGNTRNNGWSYSYFAWNLGIPGAPSADYRYFKVY